MSHAPQGSGVPEILQELVNDRRGSRAAEQILRDSLKRHAQQKSGLTDGTYLMVLDKRRLGPVRLQSSPYSETSSPRETPAAGSPFTQAGPIPQMAQQVQLTRTMSRTIGLGIWHRRRRTTYGQSLSDGETNLDSDEEGDEKEDAVSSPLEPRPLGRANRQADNCSSRFIGPPLLYSSAPAISASYSSPYRPSGGPVQHMAAAALHGSGLGSGSGSVKRTGRVDQLLTFLRNDQQRSKSSRWASPMALTPTLNSTSSLPADGNGNGGGNGGGNGHVNGHNHVTQRCRSVTLAQLYDFDSPLATAANTATSSPEVSPNNEVFVGSVAGFSASLLENGAAAPSIGTPLAGPCVNQRAAKTTGNTLRFSRSGSLSRLGTRVSFDAGETDGRAVASCPNTVRPVTQLSNSGLGVSFRQDAPAGGLALGDQSAAQPSIFSPRLAEAGVIPQPPLGRLDGPQIRGSSGDSPFWTGGPAPTPPTMPMSSRTPRSVQLQGVGTGADTGAAAGGLQGPAMHLGTATSAPQPIVRFRSVRMLDSHQSQQNQSERGSGSPRGATCGTGASSLSASVEFVSASGVGCLSVQLESGAGGAEQGSISGGGNSRSGGHRRPSGIRFPSLDLQSITLNKLRSAYSSVDSAGTV